MSVKKHIKAEERGGVLVLDRSYRPMGTTPLTRAMLKLSLTDENGKSAAPYTVVEWSRNPDGSIKVLHRPNGETVQKPSIVRMIEWVTIPNRGSTSLRSAIYQRDKFTCQYCAQRFAVKDLTLDHVYPRSKGGDNDSTNLVAACKKCNNRKAARTPEEARMPLLNPHTLYKVGLHRVQLCHYAESRPDWKPYLFLEDASTGTYG